MIVLFVTAMVSAVMLIWLTLKSLQVVNNRQVAVIYNASTNSVRRLLVGPRLGYRLPWLEQSVRLDLTMQQGRVYVDDVITADRLAVRATLALDFVLDPDRLRAVDVNEILPFLGQAKTIAEDRSDYCLRILAARHTLNDLLSRPGIQARLQDQVRDYLDTNLRPLGLRVLAVRLLLRPTHQMLEAELAAQTHVRALLALMNIADMDQNLAAQILPLEILRLHRGDGRLLASLNLPGVGNHNGNGAQVHWILDGNE